MTSMMPIESLIYTLPPMYTLLHRSNVQQLHVAWTSVTNTAIPWLLALEHLKFLDVRGTGVRRQSLQQLERNFPQLHLAQGSVLTSSAALAAAIVNHPWLFVCACDPAAHSTHAAAAAAQDNGAGPPGSWLARWSREGTGMLLAAAEEEVLWQGDQHYQQSCVALPTAPPPSLPPHACSPDVEECEILQSEQPRDGRVGYGCPSHMQLLDVASV